MGKQHKDNNAHRAAIVQAGRCWLVATDELVLDISSGALFDAGDGQPGCFADPLFVTIQQDDVVGVRPVPVAVDLLPVRQEVLHQVVLRGMTLLLAPFFGVVLVPTMRIPRLASPLHDVQERCFPLVVAEPLLQRGPRGDAGGTHHTTELVGLEARSAVAVRGGREIAQRDHAVCLGATWMLLEGQNDLLRLQNSFPRESACA